MSIAHQWLTIYIEVAQLFCTIGICFNQVFKQKLSNPFVTNVERGINVCCGICPGCRNELQIMFQPMDLSLAKKVLFDAFTKKQQYTAKDLAILISKEPNLDEKLYKRRRKTVPKKDINLSIFQLIGWQLIVPIYDTEENGIVLEAAKADENEGMFNFQKDRLWSNIPTF